MAPIAPGSQNCLKPSTLMFSGKPSKISKNILKLKKRGGEKGSVSPVFHALYVWHFMRDIIFGLSRICGLQSRACGCMLGINPHLNPRGLLEMAQMLNETVLAGCKY